uniref:Uncharacterized protein n=1 Tax=Photinus pyralis TaxID=7054 RepID=A0A1Y1KS83_PHOPY
MPLKGNPTCLKCETSESPLWTNAENLGAICLDCINETKDSIKNELEEEEEKDNFPKSRRRTRTTRSYKTRLNPLALPKSTTPKGRGRRGHYKKTPVKAPIATSTPVTSDSVFYKVYATVKCAVSVIIRCRDPTCRWVISYR